MHVQLNQFLYRIIYYEIIKKWYRFIDDPQLRIKFLGLPTCFENYLNHYENQNQICY